MTWLQRLKASDTNKTPATVTLPPAVKEKIDKNEKRGETNASAIAGHDTELVGIKKDVEHIKATCDRLETAITANQQFQADQTKALEALVSKLK